jgi:hypothetical protein
MWEIVCQTIVVYIMVTNRAGILVLRIALDVEHPMYPTVLHVSDQVMAFRYSLHIPLHTCERSQKIFGGVEVQCREERVGEQGSSAIHVSMR